MLKRRLALMLALSLVAAVPVVSPGARAQTPPPALITDSLTALNELVSKAGAHCQLKDAADDEVATNTELPFVLCDDGIPSGASGGPAGIPVPVAYQSNSAGNDYTGLPGLANPDQIAEKVATYDLQPDEQSDRVTLDVDITLPPSRGIRTEYGEAWPVRRAPKAGWPVIVFMHGCCAGNKNSWKAGTVDAANEQWHQSNAWFASRGYVVVNYTARGFRNPNDEGSSGTTQLDSRSYEINDYQYLVGLLADHDAKRRAEGLRPIFNVNPAKVGAVGGSYGGGFSWLAMTDPRWRSPLNKVPIKLAAAAPRYGWTDLLEALVPSGHYFDTDPDTGRTAITSTKPAEAPSLHPLGVEKQSIVALLYAQGNLQNMNHTTFPAWLDEAYQRLQEGEPYDGDETLERVANWLITDRSAYYQERFWTKVGSGLRVPAFIAATWTDPLFTTMQSGVAFYNKLKSIAPKYPMQMYLGDYQHFAANKAKEWGDLCGDDHHVCTLDDYRNSDGVLNLNRAASRVRIGANTRMNRFLDFYLNKKGVTPARKVWATTQICDVNATEGFPADEPGIEYAAGSWRGLSTGNERFAWEGGGVATTTTTSTAADNHSQQTDPGYRQTQTNKCSTLQSSESTPGVVQYEDVVDETFTMMGLPTLELDYTATSASGDYWIAARLFDKRPDGSITLVTRGVCKVNTAAEPDVDCSAFQLWGNAWTFEKDHSVLLEITQSDTPTFRLDNFPSSIAYAAADLKIPVTDATRRKDFRD